MSGIISGGGGFKPVQVNYTGDGQASHIVSHGLGKIPTLIYICNMTDAPAFNIDIVAIIVITDTHIFIVSGNNAYSPIRLAIGTVVTATNVDVGAIQVPTNANTSNTAAKNYKMISF